jgi:hypothetical protein
VVAELSRFALEAHAQTVAKTLSKAECEIKVSCSLVHVLEHAVHGEHWTPRTHFHEGKAHSSLYPDGLIQRYACKFQEYCE